MRPGILAALFVLLLAAATTAFILGGVQEGERSRRIDARYLRGLFAARRGDASTPPQLSGGLLVHMITLKQARTLLAAKDFVLEGNDAIITDCSPSSEASGSCSAWTYLREDLMPTIFNTPTQVTSGDGPAAHNTDESSVHSTPSIGIIVDPALAWSLITSMGVVDASSNERNCGQYYFDNSKAFQVQCVAEDRGVGRSDPAVVVRGPLKASEECPEQCEDGDERCRHQNSGGTIAVSFLGKSELGNWGCSDCSGPFPAEGLGSRMAGCSQSALPYVCSLDDGPADPTSVVDPTAWAPYSKTQGYARAHVGKGGERFQNLFEREGALAEVWEVGGNQCKFRRDDWLAWAATIKRFYNTWWKHYDPVAKTLREQKAAALGKNHQLSCPGYFYSFFENEVNMYFNPKSDDPHFAALARRQSEILRNAVVGFFSVGLTCKEQLASLEGSECVYDGTTYRGAAGRCAGWFCGKAATSECVRRYLAEEPRFLRESAAAARELAARFNDKYRVQKGARRPAGVFQYVGSNSSFVDPRFLEKLVAGKTIPLHEVFREAGPPLSGEAQASSPS